MSPIRDANLVVRSATEGTFAADTVISVDLEGTPLGGMALYVNVPVSTSGCNPTISIDIHASTASAAATTDGIIAARATIIEEGGQYVVPFSTRKRSVAFAFRIGGTSSPTFSAFTADIILNVGHDWTRTVEFH